MSKFDGNLSVFFLRRVYTGNFGRQLREATQPKIRKLLPKIAEVFTHKNCFVSTFQFYRLEHAEINNFISFQTLLFNTIINYSGNYLMWSLIMSSFGWYNQLGKGSWSFITFLKYWYGPISSLFPGPKVITLSDFHY